MGRRLYYHNTLGERTGTFCSISDRRTCKVCGTVSCRTSSSTVTGILVISHHNNTKAASLSFGFLTKKELKEKERKTGSVFTPFYFWGGFRWRLSLDHGQIVLTVVIRAFIQGHNGGTIRWKFLEVTTSVIGGRFRGWQKMQEIIRTAAHVSFWEYHFVRKTAFHVFLFPVFFPRNYKWKEKKRKEKKNGLTSEKCKGAY